MEQKEKFISLNALDPMLSVIRDYITRCDNMTMENCQPETATDAEIAESLKKTLSITFPVEMQEEFNAGIDELFQSPEA